MRLQTSATGVGHSAHATASPMFCPIQNLSYFPELSYCSAWSRLKLNAKIGLDTTTHHPPAQTFRPLPGLLGG